MYIGFAFSFKLDVARTQKSRTEVVPEYLNGRGKSASVGVLGGFPIGLVILW